MDTLSHVQLYHLQIRSEHKKVIAAKFTFSAQENNAIQFTWSVRYDGKFAGWVSGDVLHERFVPLKCPFCGVNLEQLAHNPTCGSIVNNTGLTAFEPNFLNAAMEILEREAKTKRLTVPDDPLFHIMIKGKHGVMIRVY